MVVTDRVVFSGAVEGVVDEAVFRSLISHCGGVPGTIYGKQGKHHLLNRLQGYNRGAAHGAWLVLIDLDSDSDCAPAFRAAHLPHAERSMCFRVAVRAVEAWLLADAQRLASYFAVPRSRIPADPDGIRDPKRFLVDLARRSRRWSVREDMVPRPESGRTVGPAYAARLTEFVQDRRAGWDPEAAAGRSDSLARCLAAVRQVVAEGRW